MLVVLFLRITSKRFGSGTRTLEHSSNSAVKMWYNTWAARCFVLLARVAWGNTQLITSSTRQGNSIRSWSTGWKCYRRGIPAIFSIGDRDQSREEACSLERSSSVIPLSPSSFVMDKKSLVMDKKSFVMAKKSFVVVKRVLSWIKRILSWSKRVLSWIKRVLSQSK